MANTSATPEMAITALADPTRRAIMNALREGPLAVSALANDLPVTRPAVSQHLRVLSDAGLLTVTPHGTRRLYSIAPDGIAAIRSYLDSLWTDALDAFAVHATALAGDDDDTQSDP